MAKKRSRSSRSSRKRKTSSSTPWLIVLIFLGFLGLYYYRQEQAKKITPPNEMTETNHPIVKPAEEKAESLPQTRPHTEFTALAKNFPTRTWLDNYLKVKVALNNPKESNLLVGIGIAPQGKDPDQIKNPETLHPALLVLDENKGLFHKMDEFDFETSLSTQAGISGKDLRGIPRITKESLVDLDGDGHSELWVPVDTRGQWTEAVALLQFKNGHLEWVKTRSKEGQEKLALWLKGSTPSETQELSTEKGPDKKIRILHNRGRLDPAHADRGYVWKKSVWEFKEGVLIESNP